LDRARGKWDKSVVAGAVVARAVVAAVKSKE
jgi:hypothetical protein